MILNSSISPIIIIGMHRSGTTLIARLLEEIGIFMGWKMDKNHESMLFKFLNQWYLNQSGGSWDNPETIDYLLDNLEYRTLVLDYTHRIFNTRHIVNYIGWHNYLRFKTLKNLPFQWGWKDPRNTFSLPLWLDLFPNAKILHIYRHGVDVASSLRMRQKRMFSSDKQAHLRQMRHHLYWFKRKRRTGFSTTIRCATLEGGFSLWETYLTRARKHLQTIGENNLEIKYEAFLLDPGDYLAYIADFCELPISNKTLQKCIQMVDKSRVYAYQESPELVNFANDVNGRLKKWGY